jgi:hypothetical protein
VLGGASAPARDASMPAGSTGGGAVLGNPWQPA